MKQYVGKDTAIIGRLAWWSKQYGNLPLNKISVVTIRDGLKLLSNGKVVRYDGLGKPVVETSQSNT